MRFRTMAAIAASVVLSVAVASPASADLVKGTFSGTITDSYDLTDIFGAGTGDDSVTGKTVTGSFSYRVSDVPSNQCSPGYGCYYDTDGPDWLTLSVTFNGHTFTIPVGEDAQHWQGVYNYAKNVAGYDFFEVFEENYKSQFLSDTLYEYRDDILYASFFDYITESILDDIVPTSFSFTPDGNDDGADGQLVYYHYIFDASAGEYPLYIYSYAHWSLTNISARLLAVPEPATLALFAAGLLGLGFMGRRLKTV